MLALNDCASSINIQFSPKQPLNGSQPVQLIFVVVVVFSLDFFFFSSDFETVLTFRKFRFDCSEYSILIVQLIYPHFAHINTAINIEMYIVRRKNRIIFRDTTTFVQIECKRVYFKRCRFRTRPNPND